MQLVLYFELHVHVHVNVSPVFGDDDAGKAEEEVPRVLEQNHHVFAELVVVNAGMAEEEVLEPNYLDP